MRLALSSNVVKNPGSFSRLLARAMAGVFGPLVLILSLQLSSPAAAHTLQGDDPPAVATLEMADDIAAPVIAQPECHDHISLLAAPPGGTAPAEGSYPAAAHAALSPLPAEPAFIPPRS